jgi:phosphatidylglycerophosphatase GEP4
MVQSFNLPAILNVVPLLTQPSLCVPHLIIRDFAHLNLDRLKQLGIKAIAFDKDNTLTLPYSQQLYPSFRVILIVVHVSGFLESL